MRGGRDPRLPEACSLCGKQVGVAYNPDDWVMRIDASTPQGVVALCPECAAASPEKENPHRGTTGRGR